MVDARLRIYLEPGTQPVEQPRQSGFFLGMIMRPDCKEFTVEPESVQVFEAAFEMRISLDVVEHVARLWLRQEIEALARLAGPQFHARLTRFAGLLQARLNAKPVPARFGHAAGFFLAHGKRGHGADTRGLELGNLLLRDVGDVEQTIGLNPCCIAMLCPATQRAIRTRHWPGQRRRGYECF